MRTGKGRRMRYVGAWALVLLLLAGCAGETENPFAGQTIDWSACHGHQEAAQLTGTGAELEWVEALECGTVTVPLDPDEPDGRTLEMAVVRHPAREETDEHRGSLVLNFGGPGVSGVSALHTPRFDDRILDAFDLVAFDPRGVGGSEGFACGDRYALLDAQQRAPHPRDMTRKDLAPFEKAARAYADSCADVVGEDFLALMGTVNVVEDLDILRDALGDDKLTFVGYSYGTRIGALYADTFPERTRAMVLDAAVLTNGSGIDSALGRAAAFRNTWHMFADHCTATVDDCPFTDPTTANAHMKDILDGLRKEPATAHGVPVDGELLFLMFGVELYREESWDLLAALLTALDNEDTDTSEELLDDLYEKTFGSPWEVEPVAPEPITEHTDPQAALTTVNCADRRDAPDPWEYLDAARISENLAPLLDPTAVWDQLPCAYWPKTEEMPEDIAVEGAPPLMVIGTVGDPTTPYAWSEELADQLGNAHLVTYEGAGHTLYGEGRSACVEEIANAYLLAEEIPESDMVCPR